MAKAQGGPYIPPTRWKRVDAWRTRAADGSLVWMDMRGLVGLQQPNGLNFTLGASAEGAHGELHDGRHGPPPKGRPIQVFVGPKSRWWRGGYQTNEMLSEAAKRDVLDSLKKAMGTLGYAVRYIQVPAREQE